MVGRSWFGALLGTISLAPVACGGSGATTDAGADLPAVPSPACPSPDEAPLRQGDGGFGCTRVGPADPPATGEWPDATGAADPVAYVRPGARGGDGARATPFGDLAAALATSPGTVLLSRGTHGLAAPVDITRAVAIRGVGDGATVLEAAGAEALRVRTVGAARFAVSLAGLTLRAGAAAESGVGIVSALGPGVTLALADVSLRGGGDGLRAVEGATVCAARVAVRDVGQRGVVALGARIFLRDALVRGAADVGVLVDRGHLTFTRGLVADSGRDGVAVRGSLRGAGCVSEAECAGPSPCEGFALTQRCVASAPYTPRDGGAAVPLEQRCRSVDALTDVALLGNRVTGLRASRSAPTADEDATGQRETILARPGPELRAERIVVAGTRALPGAPGGDGVYAGPGATVSLDESAGESQHGLASAIVGNARVGLLADGDRATDPTIPAALRRAAALSVSGALVASNAGPGIFLQERARADRLAYTRAYGNGALGLGVTSGAGVALMLCDQFLATRMGAIAPENPAVRPFVVGDGVSMSVATGTGPRTRVVDSEFSGNARFGLVLDAADATLDEGTHGGNRGADNGFGVGLYGGARLDGTTALGAIRGRSAAVPAAAPTARESLPSGAM